jgi:hypothetical protein
MSEKKDDGLAGLVLEVIISSEKDVATCQEIKDSLTAQGSGLYSREEIMEAMDSILEKRGGEFKPVIVTRRGKLAFAIRKREKFWY